MLQLRKNSIYLDLDEGTKLQLTLRNPMFFNKTDGSASYNCSIPETDRNRVQFNFFESIIGRNSAKTFTDYEVLFDGVKLFDCTITINKVIDNRYDCVLSLGKGDFNYQASNLNLTKLIFPEQTFTMEKKGKPDSILNVTDFRYPQKNFTIFPVYNPGLFGGTFFDEYFNLSMPRFKKMVEELQNNILGFLWLDNPPFGYFFRLQTDGWITHYTDADGTEHTAKEDFYRRLDEYCASADRYSNSLTEHPNYIYHFYIYLFETIEHFGLWPQVVAIFRLCNEFYAAGWVNYVDVKFISNTYTPGKHIVPFPYMVGVLEKTIEQLGYVMGENFFIDDAELRSLVMCTMNAADTHYGMIEPITTPINIRVNEHLPDITALEFLQSICTFFNCTVFTKGKTIRIRKNIDVLKNAQVVEFSDHATITGLEEDKKSYTFHLNVQNDDWFSEKVKSEGVRKNGTGDVYGINTTKCFNSGEPYGLSTNATIPSFFTTNDYLELYVSAPANGDIVTVQKVNWFIESK